MLILVKVMITFSQDKLPKLLNSLGQAKGDLKKEMDESDKRSGHPDVKKIE
jgi:Sec-independent protein translocase protein TatA